MRVPTRIICLCLISLSFFFTNELFAQENKLMWGIKAGGNIGAPVPFGNIPDGASGAPIVGLNLGSWLSYTLNKDLTLKLEFNYSVKGASFETPVVDLPYVEGGDSTVFNGMAEGKFDNQYLEWPLYIQYKIFKKISLTGGIYFAYMFATATYANGEGTVGYSPTTVSRSIPFNEELNKFDYGARLGAVYTNGGKFLFDANLSYGIPSIFKKSYETIDYSINNFYFQFSVMYNFSKGLSID